MPSKNAKRKVWCRNLERARECKKQKTRICGVSESKIKTCQNTAFLTGTNSHLDVPSSPCKSVHANEVVVSTLRTWFGGSAKLADIANSPTILLRQAAHFFASPNTVLHSPSTIDTSNFIDDSLPQVAGSSTPRSPVMGGPHLPRSYPMVTCEDVEDEEDMVAIGGVRWREGPEARPLNVLLEEVINEFSPTSIRTDDGSDKTDAENDELTKNIPEARAALTDLQNLLWPPRKDRTGYKRPDFDPTLKGRLESMEKFLWKYVDINDNGTSHAKNSAGGEWTRAADETAHFLRGREWLSRNLQTWSRAYINNRTNLPTHEYGNHKTSRIDDEVLAADIKLHLQSIGKYVRAQDIVDYLKRPEVQANHGLKKTVSLATAQRWMFKLDYRWREEKKGQYIDGHEHDDVVTYRQNVFLPLWKSFAYRLRNWREDDIMMEEGDPDDPSRSRRVVVWFHNESTFYAHDRRDVCWVHLTEGAVPKPKGEGASLMVAHFVSADYGWLQSVDGKESARILFKAGKGRDRYFTTDNILVHATLAMDILDKHFPHDDHVLVFDNATTHVKRADDAPAARDMPKNPSKTWGAVVTIKDAHGNVMRDPTGKDMKKVVHSRVWLKFFVNKASTTLGSFGQNVGDSSAPRTKFRTVAVDTSFIINPTS
ncbi:hypothetical protein EDB19DRAFT_1973104 [Suillus lakei]|nr:hypothetical protein EDB19DRAFT_1973104 [Suillus lakei]